MKEIQSLLDKIKSLSADSPAKSAIDVDLMLDYTRRIYEILLKERAASTAEKFENAEPEPVSDNKPEETVSGSDLVEEVTHESTIVESDETVTEPAIEAKEDKQNIFAEEETSSVEQPYEQHNSISFEPPHPAEEQPFFPEEGIEEDKPEENTFSVKDIPEPVTEADILADYAQIFHYNAPLNESVAKGDIRKYIGINDKYLFLNELFYSRKKEYENALDKINGIADYKQALAWVRGEVALAYKWDDEDETVQDFYSTLEKYFLER